MTLYYTYWDPTFSTLHKNDSIPLNESSQTTWIVLCVDSNPQTLRYIFVLYNIVRHFFWIGYWTESWKSIRSDNSIIVHVLPIRNTTNENL